MISNYSVYKPSNSSAASNKKKTHYANNNRSTSYSDNNRSVRSKSRFNAIKPSKTWTDYVNSRIAARFLAFPLKPR